MSKRRGASDYTGDLTRTKNKRQEKKTNTNPNQENLGQIDNKNLIINFLGMNPKLIFLSSGCPKNFKPIPIGSKAPLRIGKNDPSGLVLFRKDQILTLPD